MYDTKITSCFFTYQIINHVAVLRSGKHLSSFIVISLLEEHVCDGEVKFLNFHLNSFCQPHKSP